MPQALANSAGSTPRAEIGRALVVGAGVAGIRAALDLAETGCQVTLVDASPAIGGLLALLEHQFPDNHCGICRMLPEVGQVQSSLYCMRKGLFHDRIEIVPLTSIEAVQGGPGAFQIDLVTRPHRIRASACAGCAAPCVDACPVDVPDEFNRGLTRRKAIFRPNPDNTPDGLSIDDAACNRCGECVRVCPRAAIDLEATDSKRRVGADVILLATGSRLYQLSDEPESGGWQTLPNVVTSLQLERLLSLCGRRGTLRRPSDGKPVERIAWLQCVGSRDRKHDRDYCSSVCCMFALKEATLVRETTAQRAETSIFYMDMRTWGKGFQRYRTRAEKLGVRLRRARLHDVAPMADGGLRLRWLDPASGTTQHESFDLLVLSTGVVRHAGAEKLASLFGVELSVAAQSTPVAFEPAKSWTPGVFVCGSFAGKADIAGSIVSATAAASAASKLLVELGRNLETESPAPPVLDTWEQEPRVAVVLCRCRGRGQQHEDSLEKLSQRLARRPGVTGVHVVDSPCEPDGQQQVQAILAKNPCNRVLFGACLPHVYKQGFPRLAGAAGIHPALVKVMDAIGPPTKDVVRAMEMALDGLKATEAHRVVRVPIARNALVVGGGVTGMRVALSLAERGVKVDLVEKSERLGGATRRHVHSTLEGGDPQALVSELETRTSKHERIALHLGSSVVRSIASPGRRETVIRDRSGQEAMIVHGATVLATGAHEAATGEYGYGASERVVTLAELESGLASGRLDPADMNVVVMIQCVGSREPGGRAYCSRVCCAGALKNAQRIQERNPAARVVVLYRDLMTTGAWEQAYTEARARGVLFATYSLDSKPTADIIDGRPRIGFLDSVLGRRIEVSADWLVLSTGLEADETSAEIARIFGAARNEDGFFEEASSKWRPVDSLRDGVFLAGTAHSPQSLDESLAQAEACAHRVFATLSRAEVTLPGMPSDVHDALCARCKVCMELCPVHARDYDAASHRIVVDPLRCRACGLCAAGCPSAAARLTGTGERQIMAAIEAALDGPRSEANATERGLP